MFRRFAVQAVEPGIGDQARVDEPRQKRTADEDGREHADDEAQGQVDGKALDRAAAHDDEDDGGNHDRDVGVEDGVEGAAEAGFHRRPQTLADEDFFLEAFKNEDVRIDGKAHGQDDTGNARQGQCRVEVFQDAQQDEDVDQQGDVGDDAGHAVNDDQEDHNQDDADGKGLFTLDLRIEAEARPDGADFHDFQFNRQGTGTQEDGQVLGIFQGLAARNDGFAARNRFVDDRVGQEFTVKVDTDLMAHVGRRQVGEFLRPFIGEFNGNDVLVALVNLFFRRLQVVPGHARRTAFILELHDRCLADCFDGFFRVLFPRQLDDDAAGAFFLDKRFGQAHFIDTAFDDGHGTAQGVFRNRCVRRIFSFQDDMRTALQVEALFDGVGKRINQGNKGGQDDDDCPEKFYHVTSPQQYSPLWVIFNSFFMDG